jgi:hypothetical protein
VLDKLIKFVTDVPDHIWALVVVLSGGLIAITHGLHSFEVGSSLTAAGLTMYKGKQS